MSKVEHFNDAIIQHCVHQKRDEFISQLRNRENDILRLAATRCGKTAAQFFQSEARGQYYARGSYNMSYFVEFADGQRCVFRVPLRPCLAYCPRSKVECEVATIQHLSNSTTIPVPKVLAHCSDSGPDPLSTFMILDYIDGKLISPAEFYDLSADNRIKLYKSLADVYIQLRRQAFPSIGKLKMGENGVCIGEKTASIEMNMMQLEGLDPFGIQNFHHDGMGLLASADTYSKMLLSIGYNAFLKSRNAVTTDMGLETLYNHFLFSKQAQSWINRSLDGGPFVLVHGDFYLRNLLVDDNMRLVGLIDWEWSRVVPVQYFMPPLWFSTRDAAQLANPNSWLLYMRRHFTEFLTIVKSREDKMYGNSILHDEWLRQTEDAAPLIANALENWTEVDWFIHQSVYNKDPSAAETALLAFADDDPLHSLLAEVKEQDYRKYETDLGLLQHETNGQGKVSPLKSPWTLDWTASTRKLQGYTGTISVAVATTVVLAAIWSRLRPTPSH